MRNNRGDRGAGSFGLRRRNEPIQFLLERDSMSRIVVACDRRPSDHWNNDGRVHGRSHPSTEAVLWMVDGGLWTVI